MGSPSPIAVSVITPVYNAAPFIGATLASVFAQSFTDYEVIVVDDGSSDTAALHQALLPYRGRIICLTQTNGGPSRARNAAIREARGTYVALLDSDDLWMPGYLAEQVRRLEADRSIDLLYSDAIIFGDSPLAGRTVMSLTPSNGDVTFESLIEERCTVLTSCTVARRQAVIDAGLFDERFIRCEDVQLWLRLAFRGCRLAYHRTPLVQSRRRRGSLSEDPSRMIEAFIEVLSEIEATLPVTTEQRRLLRRRVADLQAYAALQEGKRLMMAEQYEAAVAALARSAAREPLYWKRARLGALQITLRLMPRLMRRLHERLRQPAPTTAAHQVP
jgi:glycosyltransferase involved in cell wall biosynthesis